VLNYRAKTTKYFIFGAHYISVGFKWPVIESERAQMTVEMENLKRERYYSRRERDEERNERHAAKENWTKE
jgi:hypothetical protein